MNRDALRSLAHALILWPGRGTSLTCDAVFHGLHKENADRFFDVIAGSVRESGGALSRTNFDAALTEFCHEYPRLTSWYSLIGGSPHIRIEWRNREPLIDPGCVGEWERLSDGFDPDSLLIYDLAARYGIGMREATSLYDLDGWGTIPRVGDNELISLWSRGLSDLHIHLGGVRIVPWAWLEIMSNTETLGLFAELQTRYNRNGLNFSARVRDARDKRNRLLTGLLAERPAVFSGPTTDRWWSVIRHVLLQERKMLTVAWSVVMREGPSRVGIEADLDGYLTLKHEFMRLARQPAFERKPGLRSFEADGFAVLKRKTKRLEQPSRRKPAASLGPAWYGAVATVGGIGGTTTRWSMKTEGDACAYLLEAGSLRRIELRIAPFDRASEYVRYSLNWHELVEQLKRHYGQREVAIRIAVHFKRSREKGPKSYEQREAASADATHKLAGLDRQSAAMRLALNSRDLNEREAMHRLARIDVAGQERDTQAALFAVHMRLLRGDPEMLEFLEQVRPTHPFNRYLSKWHGLAELGQHRPALGLPRLGMTVHAGEDFSDVLDGVHQVATAIDAHQLGAGDTIGHALAIASGYYQAPSSGYESIPSGAAHDGLCWLLERLEQHRTAADWLAIRLRLYDMVEHTGRQIHDSAGWDRTGAWRSARWDDFLWLRRQRLAPSTSAYERASQLRRSLLEREWSGSVLQAREVMIPVALARAGLASAVDWARADVREEIKQKRIIIELNPASNKRVSGARSFSDLPTVSLIREVEDGLLACVNTDNPGVFSSRIENEYAFLLDGLLNGEMPSGQARDLLEKVRRIGLELVY